MAVNLRHKLQHDNFVVSQFHIWKPWLDLSRFMNKRGPSVGRGEYVIQLQSSWIRAKLTLMRPGMWQDNTYPVQSPLLSRPVHRTLTLLIRDVGPMFRGIGIPFRRNPIHTGRTTTLLSLRYAHTGRKFFKDTAWPLGQCSILALSSSSGTRKITCITWH